jgi:molybdopterin synthase catalytic subunit
MVRWTIFGRYTDVMAAVAVTSAPLDLQALTAEIAGATTGDGAITTFVGLVREQNQGRRVSFLDYEAYEPLAVRALHRILDEARDSWPTTRLGVHHRIGRLELGEASIIIVAASAHRGGRVCRVPLHDRAREADRADLEARTFRRRRCLAGRSHRRSGR